jgi:hypothetical protein
MHWTDERILEYLAENGTAQAFEIALYHGRSDRSSRFRNRARVLANAEFVSVRRREGLADEYSITGRGMRYLDGEVDADLLRPMPGARPPDKVRPDWWAGFG